MECGKLRYNSYKEAQTVVNSAKKHRYDGNRRVNKKRAKIPKRCYKCSDCGGWHLTSMAYYERE